MKYYPNIPIFRQKYLNIIWILEMHYFAPFFWRTLGPVLKCIILAKIKGKLVQRPLEALGEPVQPLQCIKIYEKPDLKSKYTHHRPPRGARISGPVSKCIILHHDKKPALESKYAHHRPSQGARIFGPVLRCVIINTFMSQLFQRSLEAIGDPHNHSKASKLTKETDLESKYTHHRPSQEGLG